MGSLNDDQRPGVHSSFSQTELRMSADLH